MSLCVEPAPDVQVNIFPILGPGQDWFDFGVRQVATHAGMNGLRAFLRLLGRAAHKPVVLSHEAPTT